MTKKKLYEDFNSIVWSTSIKHADALLAMSEERFSHEIQRAFHAPEARFSTFPLNVFPSALESVSNLFAQYSPVQKVYPPNIRSVVGKRAAFPLKFAQSSNYVKDRTALIGFASFSFILHSKKIDYWTEMPLTLFIHSLVREQIWDLETSSHLQTLF